MAHTKKTNSTTVVVSRADIEAGNTASVLKLLTSFRAQPAQFRQTVFLLIDGFNDDSRALPDVPEVRSFVRHLHAAFPWWFYYLVPMADDVLNSPLTTVLICVLSNYLQPAQDELVQFVEEGLAAMNEECERVGDSQDTNKELTAGVDAWVRSFLSLF